MSVALHLIAAGSGDLREPVEAWLTGYCAEDPECALDLTADQLLLSVHPAADPVELSFAERGQMVVSALTSTAGPGYHLFVCDLVTQMAAELGLTWTEVDDPTGYFTSGDRTAPAAKMDEWWATLTPEEQQAFPLGDFAWRGGDRDAVYYRNRALTLMWLNVRWREPLTDEERAVNSAALEYLHAAYAADPTLDYPAAEWHELAGYMEADAPPVPLPAAPPEHPIGYLRNWLRLHVRNGWTVRIPGSFAFEFEGDTWTAFDHTTTVEITIFPFDKKPAEQIMADAFQRERDESLELGPHLRRATTEYVDEDECFALNGLIAIAERLCVVNIYFADEAEREQALAIWESIEAVES